MTYSTTMAVRDDLKSDGKLGSVLVKTAQVLSKGNIVIGKIGDGLGYAAFATASSTTADKFLGIAYEDKTSTADTDEVRVVMEGEVELVGASLAQTDIGKTAYHDNSATGSPCTIAVSAGTHAVPIGKITKIVSATKCRVKIEWGGAAA